MNNIKGCEKFWPRAMIVASKGLKISLVVELTSGDTTWNYLHTYEDLFFIIKPILSQKYIINSIGKCDDRANALST